MAQFSFDIVSDYDKAEVTNAFDQTKREIANRYDFKNTSAGLDWLNADKTGLVITGDSQYHLDAIAEILRKKLSSRDQSQKILDVSQEPITSNLKMSWTIPFRRGLDTDKSKKITKLVRERFPKIKVQVQGDEVRVTGTSKDDLQAVMQALREADFEFPLNFTNFR